MSDRSWNESDSRRDLEDVQTLIEDLEEAGLTDTRFQHGMAGRRQKAAMALTAIWAGTIALHLVSWGMWVVLALTLVIAIHALRLLSAPSPQPAEPLPLDDPESLPFVSLMVAAKNEEAVIVPLVKALCELDYPTDRYELWVIDDNSSDRTPLLLEKLTEDYTQLKVFRRAADATGGKSGALNQVYPLAKGEIIGVFDADAQVPQDMLQRVLPMFRQETVGAVQMRKAIAQTSPHPDSKNFWIRGQIAEMALDSWFQERRIAAGGIGELRGNGQFVRRTAVDRCGGWNEETITDDLDLTFRLHLDGWDIDFAFFPAVQEEGVTRAISLWHQRNRWAEGGYQRYLDYWRLITRNRMGTRKTFDLLMFLMIQYILPTASVPDLLMAIARNRLPILGPITGMTVSLSIVGMFLGVRRMQKGDGPKLTRPRRAVPSVLLTALQTLRGTVYMLHWIPIVASTTARISFRPKRLKWVKTIHHGSDDDLWTDLLEQPE
jgi:1,2-diacylglycerol 3-beta-glucosyltransferase